MFYCLTIINKEAKNTENPGYLNYQFNKGEIDEVNCGLNEFSIIKSKTINVELS